MRKRIAIVGGGVVGLTCAIELSREYSVTVIAEKIGTESDSIKATAVWHVYLVRETAKVLSFATRTLERLYQIAEQDRRSGIELVRGVELFRTTPMHVPSWSHIPRVFRMLDAEEVQKYNTSNLPLMIVADAARLQQYPVMWGYEIEAPAVSMHQYLAWLEGRILTEGVPVVRRRLDSLDDIDSDYDAIVNCSGIGARELVQDKGFLPFKGQYFVLRGDDQAPRTYIGDDDHPLGMAYVIPRAGEVLVGGSAEEGREDDLLTLDFDDVKRRAGLYSPWLRGQTSGNLARGAVVGVRPFRREGMRLELDTTRTFRPTIHNYGHGGSGFSLSWGCAEEVESILSTILA